MGTAHFVLFQLIAVIGCINGYPNGAIPSSACVDMTPRHGVPPQPESTNPYSISMSFDTYLPNMKLQVRLEGNRTFRGYYVQARQTNTDGVLGIFSDSNNTFTRLHTCPSGSQTSSHNTVSHNERWRSNSSNFLSVDWIPPQYNGEVYFRGTFVQNYTTFWTGTESYIVSPLAAINFTECCDFESEISSDLLSLCSLVVHHGFVANSNTLEVLSNFLENEDEHYGLFLSFRCLHWSSSSTPEKRSRINDCCSENNVPETCQKFCEAEFFATFDGFDDFTSSFQSCMNENNATVTCQFSTNQCASNGSFLCQCDPGYTGDGVVCEDIDECVFDAVCSSDSSCINTDGSYFCTSCNAGFTGDGFNCTNIDECQVLSVTGCSTDAHCSDTVGSYVCICNGGFTGNGFTCQDLDECLASADGCSPNAHCTNTGGSYLCTCNPGYTGNGFSCEDIDECVQSTDGCSSEATCTNTDGNYVCTCIPGYTGNGFGCEDINECVFDAVCSSDSSCINTDGSYFCTSCNAGFIGDGFNCTNIDECQVLGSAACGQVATCTDTDGSYFCTCNLGYTGNGNGFSCENIDECQVVSVTGCSADAICTDTVGSYVCTCNGGFTGNGFTCQDLDECLASADECSSNAHCTNTGGSYFCTCNPGYTGNGFSCEDIDECVQSTDGCNSEATCTNTDGNYVCTCNPGYTGNGFICEDLNECVVLADECSSNAHCTNTGGSYFCTCNPGYTGNGFICEELPTFSPPATTNTPPATTNTPPATTNTPPGEIQFPPNAVVYTIEIVILTNILPQERGVLFNQVQSQLLEPALSSLPDYHSVRLVGDVLSSGELIVEYDVILIAVTSGTQFQFTLQDTITVSIDAVAASLNYVISGGGLAQMYNIAANIPVSYTDINDECNPANVCSFLYAGQPTCVTVGDMSIACICLSSNNVQVACEDIPPPPVQQSALRYRITTTIQVNNPSERQIAHLNNALEENLLLPALAGISGYSNIRFVSFAFGSLLVTSQADFVVSNLNNPNSIPTTTMLRRNLESRSMILDDTLSSPQLAQSATFSRNFVIAHEDVNSQCSSGVECPSPPTGYESQCVEIGRDDFVCLCVSTTDNAEVDCSSIGNGGGGAGAGSLSVGAIVGIAVGGVAAIIIVIVVACCCLKRRKSKNARNSRTSDSYLDVKDISTVRRQTAPGCEPVYMEITPEQYGQYIYLDKPPSVSENVEPGSVNKGFHLESADGNETPELQKKPALPKNHPTQEAAYNHYEKPMTGNQESDAAAKDLVTVEEGEDGYLMPVNERKETKLTEPKDISEAPEKTENLNEVATNVSIEA